MKHSSFPRTLLRNICRASLLLLLAAACSNENPADEPNPDDKRVTVEFLVPGITSMGTPTRGESALPEGATVRILVGNAGESPNLDLLVGNQTYYVKGGRLVPCTVDDNGKFIAEDPNGKISLKPWDYTFYVCTPALKIIPHSMDGNIPSIAVPQNLDYAGSITEKKPIAFTGVVALNALEHKCARLQLKVNRDNDAAISAMTVKSATLTGFSRDSWETYLGHSFYGFIIAGGTTSATTTAFTQDATNPKLSSADLFLLPCTVTTPVKVTYEIAYTVLGIERTETVSADLPSLTLVEGKSYTLTANFAKDGGIHLSISDWDQSNQDNSMGEGVYPYTKDGNIVVWKDNYGGTTATVHEGWFQTPDHKYADPANSVAACLEVAKSDAGAWAQWTNTNYGCTAPWRRPTVRELEPIVSLYHSGKLPNIDTFAGRDRATSTYGGPRAGGTDDSWNVWGSGGSYADGIQNLRYTRCVRDIFVGTTYPYTVNGRFIVSKDAAGTSGAALHANWTQTPDHKNTDPANSVSARFEVAVGNAGSGAWNSTNYLCTAPWRRPTLEEMKLIVAMSLGGKLTGVNSTTGAHYATSTRDANRADGSWNVNGNTAGDIFMDGIANPRATRCIRDF